MRVSEVRQDLFDIFGFVDTVVVFERITKAMRSLQKHRPDGSVDLVQVHSWDDKVDISDKYALLYMLRAHELFRNQFIDEALKYESLAVNHYLASSG